MMYEGLLRTRAAAVRAGTRRPDAMRLLVTGAYPCLQQKLHELCGLGGGNILCEVKR
jgi:hypothetical protein